jgi:hypothetical protein
MRDNKLHRPQLAGHRIDDGDHIGGKIREEFELAARLCARRVSLRRGPPGIDVGF